MPLPATSAAALGDAARILDRVGDRIWPGWGTAPRQVLLVTDSAELFLPTIGAAEATWSRKRIFPPTFQATFPAVGGVPTIVIGTPEGTATPPDRWALTVLHEHFHQLQYSRPDYYTRLNALGLARGDTTGMWALNYPFPYDSAPIQQAVRRWADLLHAALAGPPRDRAAAGARARVAKHALDAMLAPDDRKYLDFQLWQEGVPRWIELQGAREARKEGLVAQETLEWQERRLVDDLTKIDLGRDRRVVVYALGAATAELLDWEGQGWRWGYFERMFALEPHPPTPSP
ncbi:MAG TPA: hypothetical protein VG940_00105 [Gemmatimonadales bacterium]|nr:hypothetical protein [Gemmatimonadales bacterium]